MVFFYLVFCCFGGDLVRDIMDLDREIFLAKSKKSDKSKVFFEIPSGIIKLIWLANNSEFPDNLVFSRFAKDSLKMLLEKDRPILELQNLEKRKDKWAKLIKGKTKVVTGDLGDGDLFQIISKAQVSMNIKGVAFKNVNISWVFPGQYHSVVKNERLKGYNWEGLTFGLLSDESPIFSPAKGLVVLVGNHKILGNIVVVYHGSNYFSILIGFKEIWVKEFSTVEKGALIGSSANSVFFWEIRKNNSPEDIMKKNVRPFYE